MRSAPVLGAALVTAACGGSPAGGTSATATASQSSGLTATTGTGASTESGETSAATTRSTSNASTTSGGSGDTSGSDSGTTETTGVLDCPTGRVLVDRPDDAVDPQIHVVYALPSDGVDEMLDVDGTLAGSVTSWNTWLAGQTGGPRLRIDTCNGQPDVTFVSLTADNATLEATGAFVRDAIEDELDTRGLLEPDKIYAVYYGGTSTFACGGGAWPPTLPGRVAAMYLLADLPNAVPCADEGFAAAAEPPRYLEFAMLHELVHTLGMVATCAPNHVLSGHSSDDNADLMYAGPLPWIPSVLDLGGDDYWSHGDQNCPDLARSAFIDPLPANAALPPGWPP